ncbi:MAG: glycoside hydrolase family 65 protein [Planctomycetes bacterium]|nr:glycoside hydrolase family 65 protein [Planctomycetota bacterium]
MNSGDIKHMLGFDTVCKPAPSEWLILEEKFEPFEIQHYETIFALANGYGGLRGSLPFNIDLGDPGFYVAGVYDLAGHQYEIVNLPCWIGLNANIDGFDFNLRSGEILEYSRALDMKQGILWTNVLWRDDARRETRWESARLIHLARRHCGLVWGRLTAINYTGHTRLTSEIDGWKTKYGSSSETSHYAKMSVADMGQNGIFLSTVTAESEIEVACATQLCVESEAERSSRVQEDKLSETMTFELPEGEPIGFEKRAAFYNSRDCAVVPEITKEELDAISGLTCGELVREHVDAWKRLWDDTDVIIEGDPRAQKAVRFNIFHLNSLGIDDDTVSIGAKGLHGNGYKGLIFWDTEIYLFPFSLYTRPAVAQALLGYRCRFLPDARENAREMNMRGARFPWNTSIDAKERSYGGLGWQDHLQADIAYAVDRYQSAVNAPEFFANCGVPLVVEAARYWVDRAEWDEEKGAYVILNITGTDEIHTGIDNNALTNYLAAWNLRRAADAVDKREETGEAQDLRRQLNIEPREIELWREMADQFYVPFDDEKGIHEQFEGFFDLKDERPDGDMTQKMFTGPVLHSMKPTQLSKQADTVLLYYLFPDDFSEETCRKGFDYYEARSTHASSLSRSIYAALGARVGRLERAYDLFMRDAELDFGEYAENDTGIHAASLGGTWQALVHGFGGFILREGVPAFDPSLPEQWDSLAFRIKFRGSRIFVRLTHETIELKTDGDQRDVTVGNRTRCVTNEWRTWEL